MCALRAACPAIKLAFSCSLLGLAALLSGCGPAIEIAPASAQAAAGSSLQLSATLVSYFGQNKDVTSEVSWSSSDPSVAAFNSPPGAVSALKAGSATLTGKFSGSTGRMHFTVTSAVLESIEVTPSAPNLPTGLTEPFIATGIYSDHTTQDLTQQVTWGSSNLAVASVGNTAGVMGVGSALSAGSTILSATFGSVSGSTILTVTSATLVSISVTPATPSIAVGLTEPFTAIGTFTDHSIQNLTTQVTWTSSNPSVAVIGNLGSAQGIATSLATGSTSISATSGGISGGTTLTVTTATLVSIAVTPANPSLPQGVSDRFTATGIFSDHSTQNLTTQVTWSSSDTDVATVSNAAGSPGLASGAAVGSSTISAKSGTISGSTPLTITAATLVSITVTPASPSVANGMSEPFTATGIYTDNSAQNLTTQVTWSSSNPNVATISNAARSQGLATSAGVGNTSISATSGNVTGSTSLTVSSATLVSIAVTPATPSIANGLDQPFTATGTYTDNSTQNLTTQVTWSSSNTNVTTVSNAVGSQGLASSAAVGSTTVSATSGAISGSTSLTVTSASLVSIAVTPANVNIANGLSESYTATGIYTDNSTQSLTTQVTWSSSNTNVATISNAAGSQGLASSAGVGNTSITAASGNLTGSTSLTVSSATLVSIAVTPATPSIANGLNESFTATGIYTDNSTQNLTTQVTWASSATNVATISNAAGSQGIASSAAVGSTTVSATSGTISGSTALTVTSATLTSIAVTPTNPSAAAGLTEPFTAIGTYTDNSTQNLTTQLTWASSDASVATISNANGSRGLSSCVAVGITNISATSGMISGSTSLTVTSATLVSIAVTPANASIANGLSEAFTATGTYTDNSTQNLTTQVTWSSSNTNIATISNAGGSQGLATAAALGSSTISATNSNITGSTNLTVTAVNGFTLSEIVTIDHTKVGNSDSAQFSMLFSGTYPNLATTVNGGLVQNTVVQQGITVPADAVFTTDSGCASPLNWEIESYNPASGTIILWLGIPTLSHTVDTVVYLCIGNSAVASYQGGANGAAWDASYQAVYHFPNGTVLGASDSTGNGNAATISGAAATSGEIGGAANIVNAEYVGTPYVQNSVTAYTVEAWINTVTTGAALIVQDRGSALGPGHSLTLTLEGAGDCGGSSCGSAYGGVANPIGMPMFADDSDGIIIGIIATTALNDGAWHHLVGTWSAVAGEAINSSEFTLYLDGIAANNVSGLNQGIDTAPLTGTAGTFIGYHQSWGTDCNCSLDEVRISTTVRSADWITAEYNNQSSPSTFYRVTVN